MSSNQEQGRLLRVEAIDALKLIAIPTEVRLEPALPILAQEPFDIGVLDTMQTVLRAVLDSRAINRLNVASVDLDLTLEEYIQTRHPELNPHYVACAGIMGVAQHRFAEDDHEIHLPGVALQRVRSFNYNNIHRKNFNAPDYFAKCAAAHTYGELGIPFWYEYLKYAKNGGIYNPAGEYAGGSEFVPPQTSFTYPSWAGHIFIRGLYIGLNEIKDNLGFTTKELLRRAGTSKRKHFWNIYKRTKERQ